jgi:hypothetical protein
MNIQVAELQKSSRSILITFFKLHHRGHLQQTIISFTFLLKPPLEIVIMRGPSRKRSGKEIQWLLSNWEERPNPRRKRKTMKPLLMVQKMKFVF